MIASSKGSLETVQDEIATLVGGNNAFALDLYGQLRGSNGNLFFSPYSISTCLAMASAGARNETERQIRSVLRFQLEPAKVHTAFGYMQTILLHRAAGKGMELNVANAMWAREGYPFLREFIDVCIEAYQARLEQADFAKKAEEVRLVINRWIAEKTRNRIRNILGPGSIHDLTVLVLVNAIYFKGAWATPFEEQQTRVERFHITESRECEVPLMHHFDQVRYMQNGDLQAIELPYATGDFSMVVLLPRKVDGIVQLESQLNPAMLEQIVAAMRKLRVEIFLPRFRLESKFELGKTLAGMGMPDAFGTKADFSGMDGRKELFISEVVHQAWGEVNEEGTEAAAATVVAMRGFISRQQPPPPPIFRADHPFVFLIRDFNSGCVLFLGRLQEPGN